MNNSKTLDQMIDTLAAQGFEFFRDDNEVIATNEDDRMITIAHDDDNNVLTVTEH